MGGVAASHAALPGLERLEPGWAAALSEVLASEQAHALAKALREEARRGVRILPPADETFAAFDGLPPEDVRVVILGQDPYPTPGHAHGLAFSYRGDGPLPRSLANVFAEIERDRGVSMAAHRGDLGAWRRQGVLLLNTALTVRAQEAGSHRRLGWAPIVDAVLTRLVEAPGPRVFLLWGRAARAYAPRLGTRHSVLEAGHPSPLSVRYFRGCGHFGETNRRLEAAGAPGIDWAAER